MPRATTKSVHRKTTNKATKLKRTTVTRRTGTYCSGGFFREKPLSLLVVPLIAIIGVGSIVFVHAATASAGPITGVGGLCLDVSGGKLANNAKVVIDSCSNGSKAQLWTIPGDGTIHDGAYCLSDKDGSKVPETHARVEACNSTANQKWQISSSGAMISTSSNLCLEVRDDLVKSGNDVWLNTCNNAAAQIWNLPKGSSNPTTPTPPTTGTLPNPDTILNFSNWELQEPVASGSGVLTIPSSKLTASYSDKYMYTSSSAGGDAVTFFTPEDGAHTTNSSYPRTELRELNANGSDANWNMVGTNIMTASLMATDITDHTVIGQVHIGSPLPGASVASSTKPLLELYYYSNGNIIAGLEKSPSGSQTTTTIGNVPLGTKFTYTIQVSGDAVTIKLNNASPIALTASSSFNEYGMYFKAGNYLQTTGTSSTVGAHDEFYSLSVQH
jgi:hypothetical protein